MGFQEVPFCSDLLLWPSPPFTQLPRFALLRGEALAALGEVEEARAMFQAAREGADNQHRPGIAWRTLLALGKLAFAEKDWLVAEANFNAVRGLLKALADTISDTDLQASFLQRGLAMIPEVPASSERWVHRQARGGLTNREMEVAALITSGDTNQEIAEKLVLSKRTVERHVANILLKLDFHSREQIAAWAKSR